MHVYKKKWKIAKNLFHHSLKSGIHIPEVKGLKEELIHTKGGDDGCILDVVGGAGNLVVSLLQVQLEEDS